MNIFNRVLVVSHHAPHQWEAYKHDEMTLNQLNSLRYAMLEYRTEEGGLLYLNIPDNIHRLDGDATPRSLLPEFLQERKPRMSMFNYDNMRDANLKYSLADIPSRESQSAKDIKFEGYTNVNLYKHNSFFTIGGLIHRTRFVGRNGYIEDGGTTAKHRLNIGRIFLPDSREWDTHDISSDMVTTTGDYMDNCIITLDHYPGPGEVPVFVIGGYLVPIGKMITALSTNSYSVDLTNSQFINRMVDQDGIIMPKVEDDGVIDVNIMKSNEYILGVFDASQTFYTFLKAENVVQHSYPVSQTAIPGKYIVSHAPELPMETGHGNLVDYVTERRCGCHVVYTNDERIRRYLASPEIHGMITGGIDPTDLLYRRTAWNALYVLVK